MRKPGKAGNESAHDRHGGAGVVEVREIRALGGEGILVPSDLSDFSAAERLIYEYMASRDWITEDELIALTGQRQAGRRMRELRKIPNITIQRRREKGSRLFMYRMVKSQGGLFDEHT